MRIKCQSNKCYYASILCLPRPLQKRSGTVEEGDEEGDSDGDNDGVTVSSHRGGRGLEEEDEEEEEESTDDDADIDAVGVVCNIEISSFNI